MKERRLYKRHTARLSSRIEAVLPSGKKKIYDLEAKNISIGGAFFYTKRRYSLAVGTRIILDIIIPSEGDKELSTVKSLMECNGTIMRSTSEGIAIKCDEECDMV